MTPADRGLVATLVAIVVVAAALVGWKAAAGGSESEAHVVAAYAGEGTEVAALYLTIDNPGADDELVGVETEVSRRTRFHDTTEAGMVEVGVVEVPGRSVTELAPGGRHVMLEDLTEPLEPGDRVFVRVRFAEAPPVVVHVPVLSFEQLGAR